MGALEGRGGDADVRLIDAAYRMKGRSSLSFLRYDTLVRIEENGKRRLALVDLKEAVEAAPPPAHGAEMPTDPAERVLAGARALSDLGERMLPVRLLGKPVVMREPAPQDLKLDIDQFTRAQAVRAAHHPAYVVGKAHGRQMDEATGQAGGGRSCAAATVARRPRPGSGRAWWSSPAATRSATCSTAFGMWTRKRPDAGLAACRTSHGASSERTNLGVGRKYWE